MKTKKPKKLNTIIITTVLMLVALCSVAVLADVNTYVSGASIRVSMISQDPDPVEPGEYIELRWMVTNLGSTPLEDVEFKLVTDYPFELLGNDDGVRILGTIQGHQKGEEGVILYYRIRINEDASEGVNDLTLKYRHRGIREWGKLDEFEIRVESVDAAIVIEDVKLEPNRIPPGGKGKLGIKIKNLADSRMKDVNLKLDLTLTSIPQPSTVTEAAILFEALPFAPTGSSSEKRISYIKPGETVLVSYDLMVYPDATSRVYKLPIILTYKDEVDNEFTKNDIIGVVVGDLPDIYVVIDSSDLIAGKKTGTVSFKFVNRGVTDVKFVDVVLEETAEYKVVSANEEYIGNIDSDDFESIDFEIYLSNNDDAETEGIIDFPLHITFKDANNVDYSEDITLKYNVYTAKEKGIETSSSGIIIVVAIVIIIVGWLVYRRWEKRRKAKKQKQQK
ncbi:COG1361 S-layer family protein [Candidatus Woesearchaeota archaeon]|nr:COG1361 S-layer family protein [Candidatus Woesearchaeota archaeon]